MRRAFGHVHEHPLLVVGQPDPGVPCAELAGGVDDQRRQAVRRDLVRRFEEPPDDATEDDVRTSNLAHHQRLEADRAADFRHLTLLGERAAGRGP